MTCIVGLEHEGKVYVGGDSAGVGGYSLTIRTDSKVFTKPGFAEDYSPVPWVMGFTTSFRMGQLLRYSLDLPFLPKDPDTDLEEFMVTEFVEAMRTALRDGGWLKKNSEREQGGTFLVGVRGQLFTIDSDLQVGRSADGYASVGCGEDLALGALYATKEPPIFGDDVEARVELALAAAAHHSAGVAGPFLVVTA